MSIYDGVRPMFDQQAAPAHVLTQEDSDRLQAYDAYESIYWSSPGVFHLVDRSESGEVNDIYLPGARKLIEATHRFLAVGWDFLVDTRFGSPSDQQTLNLLLHNLFKRELVYSKFSTQKRYGLIKGDTFWHITADPEKPQGSRVSVHELDPASVFPIADDQNLDRIVGYHLVDLVTDPRDEAKLVARRQTYRRSERGVTSEAALFELDAWDDRNLEPDKVKQVRQLSAVRVLPGITSLPVYHIKNNRVPRHMFGCSEIRGIETVMRAVNQTVTDQDLALALAGLGAYATDAAPPQDEQGEETEFEIGPGRMIELGPGEKLWRVSGVGSVAAPVQHMQFMMEQVQQGVGVPDIAAGKVDVSVAESGVSLRLQLSPILAKNAEKEQEMLGVYDHMLYDLTTQWFPSFEQFTAGTTVSAATVVDDPLPQNRDKVVSEVTALMSTDPPLITVEQAQARLAEVGYEFGGDSAEQVMQLSQRLTQQRSVDPFENRYRQELEQTGLV